MEDAPVEEEDGELSGADSEGVEEFRHEGEFEIEVNAAIASDDDMLAQAMSCC